MADMDGRDARSGEELEAGDPSVGGVGAEAGGPAPQSLPRTPGSQAGPPTVGAEATPSTPGAGAATENAPRTGEDDPPASDSDDS